MSDCKFCKRCEIINSEGHDGNGIRTMKRMLDDLMSVFGNLPGTEKKNRLEDGIQLKYGNILLFDNSSGEYVPQGNKIKYCPFCGEELKAEEDQNADNQQANAENVQ